MKSFYVVVKDNEKRTFSISGPMSDDTRITNQVCEEQDKGRNINCFSTDEGRTMDEVRLAVEKQLGLKYSDKSIL